MRDFLDKSLPFIFWTAIIVAGTWISWVVVTGRENIEVEPVEPVNGSLNEIPPAIVDQPILEEVSADGSVRWTLYLDRIIREEGAVMELANPRALYRLESGEILEVTGETGTYDEESGILILTGGVEGLERSTNMRFSVDEMTWDSGQGILTASGNVRMMQEGLMLEGAEMILNLSRELARIEISGGVTVSSSTEALSELSDPE